MSLQRTFCKLLERQISVLSTKSKSFANISHPSWPNHDKIKNSSLVYSVKDLTSDDIWYHSEFPTICYVLRSSSWGFGTIHIRSKLRIPPPLQPKKRKEEIILNCAVSKSIKPFQYLKLNPYLFKKYTPLNTIKGNYPEPQINIDR